MDRIDGPTTIDIGGGRRGFRGKDTMAGVAGTEVRAKWLNAIQEETVSVIEKSDLVPDDGDLFQFAESIRSQRLNYRVAGGTANALTVTLDPAPAAIPSGLPLRVLISATNTGAATLNVNGLGAVAIVRNDGTPLLYGDMRAGSVVEFVRIGAVWQVVGLLNSTKKFFQGVASAGGILTVDQIGSVVQFGVGAGSYTAALPVSAACPNGGRINFFHNGNYPVVLQRQGGDQIAFADGTATSSITLRTGDTLELLCLGESTTWLVIGGSVGNRAASDFKRVLAPNGYRLLPSGDIEMWGSGTGSASGAVPVVFPYAFNGAPYVVIPSVQGAIAASVCVNHSVITSTGCNMATTYNGAFAALPFSYLAIGAAP